MKTVGAKLAPFKVHGIKPGFNEPEENGASAFETVSETSFPGKWKVIYFTTKDFSEICASEIAGFAALADQFAQRGAVLLGGSVDSEYAKLAWRRETAALSRLNHYQFADSAGALVDQLGIRDRTEGVALRATFLVDPDNTIQHVSVNNLKVGRNPEEALRTLDALQTGEFCPASRPIGPPVSKKA
ncbi:alkyl hydroperoxide reductase [Pigmentiphaga sp. NML080357]|uniref:peroxiredoxin n=1 Tax=Pigmentiphaga sp. NML080357 TaxID=2008675 RepID=UPI000B4149F6|nr:peroxiredoxin [Pigmentiphaga sp. NML080357]OVZ62151.1 alkyl hydroperoxide reductase [Pigmentiphaga sp. NML080357]